MTLPLEDSSASASRDTARVSPLACQWDLSHEEQDRHPHGRVPLHVQPTNVGEAYLANFLDRRISPEWQFRTTPGEGAKGFSLNRRGFSTRIQWTGSAPGKVLFTWEWEGRIHVGDYNQLVINAGTTPSVRLIFSIRVDGHWGEPVQENGRTSHADYRVDYCGEHLEGIRVQAIADTDEPGSFGSYYILLSNRELTERLEQQNKRQVSDPTWPGYIRPQSEWNDYEPSFGLYFDTGELDALRERVARDPYAKVSQHLRGELTTFLQESPESEIGDFLKAERYCTNYWGRERDCCKKQALWRPMRHTAFFGLLDRDPRYVTYAARCALSAASCKSWGGNLLSEGYPGSGLHFVGFSQANTARHVACALDWIGFALTDAARDFLLNRLYFLGVAPLEFDLATKDYVHTMNQGLLLNAGKIPALIALINYRPRFKPMLDQAHRQLDDIARTVLGGGKVESPGYTLVSLWGLFGAYAALAQHLEVEARDILPVSVDNSMDRFGLFCSAQDALPGSLLPVGDGGTSMIGIDPIAMLTRVTGDGRWFKLLKDYVSNLEGHIGVNKHHPSTYTSGLDVNVLIYAPESDPAPQPYVPAFQLNRELGHVTCKRSAGEAGQTRLHLLGAAASEGHVHGDKGSFILEAFGEPLLIDRGVTPYFDPLTTLFKQSRMHNLVTPCASDGSPLDQINPSPVALIPEATCENGHFHAEIDCSPVWPEPVVSLRRTIDSPEATVFVIRDDVELSEARPAAVHFHSYADLTADKGRADFRGANANVEIAWDWDGSIAHAGEGLCDGRHIPVNTLSLVAPSSTKHQLVTTVKITAHP